TVIGLTTRRERKYLVQIQLLHKDRCQAVIPVVEVACNQQGLVRRDNALDAIEQGLNLTNSAAVEQSQVHHNAMHRTAIDINDGMKQTALLHTMVRNVLVFVLQNGKARQQGVAVV